MIRHLVFAMRFLNRPIHAPFAPPLSNEESNSINWQFTNQKARIKLKSLDPTI